MNNERKLQLAKLAKRFYDHETWDDAVDLCAIASRKYGVEVQLNETDFIEEIMDEIEDTRAGLSDPSEYDEAIAMIFDRYRKPEYNFSQKISNLRQEIVEAIRERVKTAKKNEDGEVDLLEDYSAVADNNFTIMFVGLDENQKLYIRGDDDNCNCYEYNETTYPGFPHFSIHILNSLYEVFDI